MFSTPLVLTLLYEDERKRLVANVSPEEWPITVAQYHQQWAGPGSYTTFVVEKEAIRARREATIERAQEEIARKRAEFEASSR